MTGNITFSHFNVCSLDFRLALISYEPCMPGQASCRKDRSALNFLIWGQNLLSTTPKSSLRYNIIKGIS